jgi:hypothetical protein
MFGIAPLLRGLLTLLEVGLVLAVLFGIVALILRLFGIDVRDIQAYRKQRQAYTEGLRRLHEQIARAESESDLLYAAAMLRDYQGQEPQPPRWAFWLKGSPVSSST